MFWQPNWTKPEKGVWEATHLNLIAGDQWIIDGNYTNTQQVRFKRATHIVFFDFPTHQALWGVIKRNWHGYGQTRDDMAPGCRERLTFEFMKYIYNFNRDYRPRILADLAALPADIPVDTVHSHAEADALLKTFGQ